MDAVHPIRILAVTDHPEGSPGLLATLRERAAKGPAQFRVLVINPAAHEAHLRHPERHDEALQAELSLHAALPALTAAAGAPVLGSVSVRHDPYLAVEEVLASEPVDELVIDLTQSGLTRALHLDLPHRLKHLGRPITHVQATTRPV